MSKTKAITTLHYGGFSCTPEHAVQVAYMVSCAEAILFESDDLRSVGEILAGYCNGDLGIEEAVSELEELID